MDAVTNQFERHDGFLRQALRHLVAARSIFAFGLLATLTPTLLYLYFVPPIYDLRGYVQSRAGSGDLTELEKLAGSNEILAKTIQSLDSSTLSDLGLEQETPLVLRRQLQVRVDPAENRLEVMLESTFPHAACRVVDHFTSAVASAMQADARQDGAAGDARIYRTVAADPDINPLGPRPAVMLAAAAGAGVALGLIGMLIQIGMDRRIISPAQIMKEMGLKTAGYVPSLGPQSSPAARGLAAYIDPESEAAVSCRSLLLNLFGTGIHHQRGAVAVTSPMRGEGRSTIALNLAATLALAGERVLLIDADIAWPTQHKLLTQADATMGFCEALDNPAAASDFICPTHVPNLFLLPCGRPSSAAAAKVHGHALSDIIRHLRSSYRYILFDAGPVLGSPETAAVAARCNSTILVLNAKQTPVDKAAEAAALLRRHRARLSAAIVNDLPNDHRRAAFAAEPPRTVADRSHEESYDDIHDFGLVT